MALFLDHFGTHVSLNKKNNSELPQKEYAKESSFSHLDRPKSAIFIFPYKSIKIFSGFKSL